MLIVNVMGKIFEDYDSGTDYDVSCESALSCSHISVCCEVH